MKRLLLFFAITLSINFSTKAQYHKYFTNEALRIDFVLSGTANTTQISLFETIREPIWGGSKTNMITPFNYGEYRMIVRDIKTNNIIFSQGFCTLFEEWQTTVEASENESAFFHTMQCPFPKNKVSITIETRDNDNNYEEVKSFNLDPDSHQIIERNILADTHKVINNGDPSECVDIAIIAEGYTAEELDIFHRDVEELTEHLFTHEPFNKLKHKFNIWMIDAISDDSGISDPRKGVWKNTALKSSFNTLNSDRYLETTHTYIVRDYAALVPYDQIYILANTEKYGGGGIYNHFSVTAAHHTNAKPVFVHEFGHSFAGLGDEYYTSEVSYSDFFDTNTEPWQPNLTTLVDFDSKWKGMMDKKTSIPTPDNGKHNKIIGVYEGGGYVAKGVYRPYIDCRMKTNIADAFCPVCQKAIEEMILFLSDNK